MQLSPEAESHTALGAPCTHLCTFLSQWHTVTPTRALNLQLENLPTLPKKEMGCLKQPIPLFWTTRFPLAAECSHCILLDQEVRADSKMLLITAFFPFYILIYKFYLLCRTQIFGFPIVLVFPHLCGSGLSSLRSIPTRSLYISLHGR